MKAATNQIVYTNLKIEKQKKETDAKVLPRPPFFVFNIL